jgi:selenocysteine lyase/cysteine desulfurase
MDGIDPDALTGHLWATRRIIVTPIQHPDCRGIRVTPNVYTTVREVDLFAEEMERVLEKGIAG